MASLRSNAELPKEVHGAISCLRTASSHLSRLTPDIHQSFGYSQDVSRSIKHRVQSSFTFQIKSCLDSSGGESYFCGLTSSQISAELPYAALKSICLLHCFH